MSLQKKSAWKIWTWESIELASKKSCNSTQNNKNSYQSGQEKTYSHKNGLRPPK